MKHLGPVLGAATTAAVANALGFPLVALVLVVPAVGVPLWWRATCHPLRRSSPHLLEAPPEQQTVR
jgi:hypothetical protein